MYATTNITWKLDGATLGVIGQLITRMKLAGRGSALTVMVPAECPVKTGTQVCSLSTRFSPHNRVLFVGESIRGSRKAAEHMFRHEFQVWYKYSNLRLQ